MIVKVIGFFLIFSGIVVGGVGFWRKRNSGGPFIVGNVSDSVRNRIARDLYGIEKPGNFPIVMGVVFF